MAISTKARYLPPSFGIFIRLFLLLLTFFLLSGIVIHYFLLLEGQSLPAYFWWRKLMYPFGISIALSFALRKYRLTIESAQPEQRLKTTLVRHFEKSDYKILTSEDDKIILAPVKGSLKLFSYWFGLELIQIRRDNNKWIAIGPYRQISPLKHLLTSDDWVSHT